VVGHKFRELQKLCYFDSSGWVFHGSPNVRFGSIADIHVTQHCTFMGPSFREGRTLISRGGKTQWQVKSMGIALDRPRPSFPLLKHLWKSDFGRSHYWRCSYHTERQQRATPMRSHGELSLLVVTANFAPVLNCDTLVLKQIGGALTIAVIVFGAFIGIESRNMNPR
jgi:hypothetical protein